MQILKIGANWCSGCIIMKPRWQKIESIYKNHGLELDTKFFDFDDENPSTQEVLQKYNILEDKAILPTFIFLDNDGKVSLRLNGEISETLIMDSIDKLLANDGIISPRQKIHEEKSKKSWWEFWK